MKILNGAEIADYMKENQAHMVRSLRARKIQPKLAILRDNDSPVILKYVALKRKYGSDIGVEVEDWLDKDIQSAVMRANDDKKIHGVIVQLPLTDVSKTDEVVTKIASEKDVDGLASCAYRVGDAVEGSSSGAVRPTIFESATATAINWLLAGYDIDLRNSQIALVGRGRLVGAPLEKMWQKSGYNVTTFRSKSDLSELKKYDIIVSATGVPHLIKNEMVKTGAIVVDAGTASEGGILVGDVDEEVRLRTDLAAITPKIGGVGPLTVTALFEHVLIAANNQS